MKKTITVQACQNETFQGAEADDRFGSGRSLVVLLRYG